MEVRDCMSKPILHVISHTHWDREWYQSFQAYRRRLVYQMDKLMDLLEQRDDYKYFHIDGQTCPIQDYLEIRPENRDRLVRHIQSGRILIGPWFVMPDEFLVSGESLVRNLALGHRICAQFGVDPTPIGYVTDIFGHCSQLPQILSGFGIGSVLLHRGVDTTRSEMAWEGPDGTVVLLVRIYPHTGYNDILSLRGQGEDAVREYERRKLALASVPVLMGMDGNDHTPAQWDLPEEIRRLNGLFSEIECIHSSIPAYLDDLHQALGEGWREKLVKVKGELRLPAREGSWNDVVQGSGSSWLPLKQANDSAEWLLSRVADPLDAFAVVQGGDSDTVFLDLAWKYLLLNHPHDSIVGCSIDQVHKDMICRFDQCRMIASDSVSQSIQEIADRIDTSNVEASELVVTVFNLASAAAGPLLEFSFEVPSDLVRSHSDKGLAPVLLDEHGNHVNYEIVHVDRSVRSQHFIKKVDTPSPAYIVSQTKPCDRFHVAVLGSVPAFGFSSWRVSFRSVGEADAPAQLTADGDENAFLQSATGGARGDRRPYLRVDSAQRTVENEFLTVSLSDDGLLTIRDRRTGWTYDGLHYFEDCGDAGDGWDHSYPENDTVVLSTDRQHTDVVSVSVSSVQPYVGQLTVHYRMMLPVDLTPDKKGRTEERRAVDIETSFTIRAGTARIDVCTRVRNNVLRHRLRVLFPTQLRCDTWYADTPFDMVERNVQLLDTTGWKEQAREEAPIKNFVAACDDKRGLAVFTKGLNEACVRDTPDREIALTLFRGFQHHLIHEKTVASLLCGDIAVEYAIVPFAPENGRPPLSLVAELDRYKLPLLSYTHGRHSGELAPSGQLLEVDPAGIVSTVRLSGEGRGVVVRLYNPVDESTIAAIRPGFAYRSAYRANMLEKPIEPLASADGVVRLALRPKEICTVLIER